MNAALSWHIHNGLSLLTTYVNDEVGGIRLANGTKRRLQITLVDDAAQEDAVKAISTSMLRGLCPSVPRVDFLLGPYSSSLSAVASKLAHESGALFMAAGASSSSVFATRPRSFGMLSPSTTYLVTGVEQLFTRGIRSIALLVEKDDATIQFCQGANETAAKLGMIVTDVVRVSAVANRTEVAQALSQFRTSKPHAVVGCTRFDVCAEFLAQAAKDPDFYVQAMMFTLCVTDPNFKTLPKMQTAYLMGVTPWSELDTEMDDLQGWSPKSFAAKYERLFQEPPIYQAVAAFAGGLLLVKAIEDSGSLDPGVVAAQLARTRVRTVFGNISFDSNRQNAAPLTTLQAMPGVGGIHNEVVTAKNAKVPMPPWLKRRCEVESQCPDGCQDDGRCSSIRLAMLVPYAAAEGDSQRFRHEILHEIDRINQEAAADETLKAALRNRRLVAVFDAECPSCPTYSRCNSSAGLAALTRILSKQAPIDGVLGPGCESACESTAILTADLNLELGQISYACMSILESPVR